MTTRLAIFFTHPIATIVMMTLFVGKARCFESGTSCRLPGYVCILGVLYPFFVDASIFCKVKKVKELYVK